MWVRITDDGTIDRDNTLAGKWTAPGVNRFMIYVKANSNEVIVLIHSLSTSSTSPEIKNIWTWSDARD